MAGKALELCDAVLGNSSALVEYCLETEGLDPNATPKLVLFDDAPKTAAGEVDESERILAESHGYTCTALHVAIVNAYHNGRMDGIAQKQRDRALLIVDLLLEAGADTGATCNKMLFCNVGDINISSPGAPLDPIALTLSLKKVKQSSIHADERIDMMDEVMERLVAARKREKSRPTPTTSIPVLVANTYRDLVLSEKFSDITIQCLEGVMLSAHRNVLSAASSVLADKLPKDDDSNFQVNRSGQIMKGVLTFIYTGDMDDALLETETDTLLAIAAEYQLEALEQHCAAKCGERLTIQNVRMMLDVGDRHKASWVKRECLDFLQRQPLPVVLGHPKLVLLSKENPNLWQELLMAVGGQYQREEEEEEEEEVVVEKKV